MSFLQYIHLKTSIMFWDYVAAGGIMLVLFGIAFIYSVIKGE
jgi:hypothetical protein